MVGVSTPLPNAMPPAASLRESVWATASRLVRRFLAEFPDGSFLQTLSYLKETEVHTYAFSVAANALLSFFPFMVVILLLCRRVFHSPVMESVVSDLLRDYLPAGQEFVIRNLNAMVGAHRSAQFFSILILLITSSGIFLPLEVALNRVWGQARQDGLVKDRSYLMNQVVSTGLAIGGGILALLSIALTAGNVTLFNWILAGNDGGIIVRVITWIVMKIFAIAASIAVFFFIYWLLPNAKVSARQVMPAAIITGLLWEVMKYAYIIALPWLNFQEVYGPFSLSVTILFWAFLSGLLLLGGARLSAIGSETASEAPRT